MKRSITIGSVALVLVLAAGGLTRACSPTADVQQAHVEEDGGVLTMPFVPPPVRPTADVLTMPFLPPTVTPGGGDKPIPETPNAIYPASTQDVPAVNEVREPPTADPMNPPPPPEVVR